MSDSTWIFWQILIGLFDVMILFGVGSYLLKNIGQFLAFGNGRVSFQDFPFFLNQKTQLTIERLPGDLNTIQLDLRCIEEAYEIRERQAADTRVNRGLLPNLSRYSNNPRGTSQRNRRTPMPMESAGR